MSATDIDLLRARWRRFRRQLKLTAPGTEEFGRADLGTRVADLHVRLLVVPSDPEATIDPFADEFWSWLQSHIPNRNTITPFGSQVSATPWGAAYNDSPRRDGVWSSYLALRRNGALDVGIGQASMFSRDRAGAQTVRGFRLLATVGRIFSALETYASLRERFEVTGPFEVSVALVDVQNSYLANFAAGWRDFPDIDWETAAAREDAYLATWEIEDFKSSDANQLAATIGSWFENCWGGKSRRFNAGNGPNAGALDWSRFS